MADIDKSLPNVEQQITLPSEQEISEETLQEEQEIAEAGEPLEITENEDGSVDINYDPSLASVEGAENRIVNSRKRTTVTTCKRFYELSNYGSDERL
jgi:hypothetical protein